MIRFFGKFFLFLLILVSIKWLLVYLTDSLNPSTGTLTGKIRLLSTLEAPTNTLFIGSSRTNTSLNPAYFDSLTQQTHAVNLGVNGLLMPYTADLCEEVLGRPESGIRYILFELSLPNSPQDPFQGKLLRNALFYWHYETAILSRWTAETDSVLNVRLNDQVYYVLSPAMLLTFNELFALKEKLSGMVRQALPSKKPRRLLAPMPTDNGYVRSTRQLTEKSAALLATHAHGLKIYQDKPLPMDSAYSFYYKKLNALQRLATQKGIKLFFYLPNRMNVEEAEVLLSFFHQLAPSQRLGIPYDARFDQLFEPRFSDDERHLNYKGAKVYTSLIAEAFCRQFHEVP